MKKTTLAILGKVQRNEMSIDLAQREIFCLLGVTNSITCRLNRRTTECSIIANTPYKKCNGCGHFIGR